MKTIRITTKQLYNNFMASIGDIVWDMNGISPNQCQLIGKVASQDIDQLRPLFKDGMTPMLMGDKFQMIENCPEGEELEIRVYQNVDPEKGLQLIGVIIDSEIKY